MDQAEAFEAWDFERSAQTVILDHTGFADEDWLESVAAQEREKRVVVVTARNPVWVSIVGSTNPVPTPEDFRAASAVLVERGTAAPGDPVKSLDNSTTELPEPVEGPRTTRRLFSVKGLEAFLKSTNDATERDLVDQLRSPLRVMPFVGAGMSAPFGYPLWDTFLRGAAVQLGLTAEVDALLDKSDFEGAAEALDERDRGAFTETVRSAFRRRDPPPDLTKGAISYLPLLTTGPIISTNFDTVIEDAFAAAGRPVRVIDGPREQPTVEAVHHNESALLKIHGTYNDKTFRVFTTKEFERGYTAGEVTLSSLALLTFTNRPLLILGSSLDKDRTVSVLANIHERLEGLWHYAILEASYSEPRLRERGYEMARLGIRPLWYAAGQHHRVAAMIRDVVERAGTTEIHKGSIVRRPAPLDRTALRTIAGLRPADQPCVETRAVAHAFLARGVTVFLGAYAHLGRLPLGDELYAALADRFEVPETERTSDRAAIAGFILARRPPDVLWRAVRTSLEGAAPTVVHRFVAALPAFLRSDEASAATWIFTTNYDTALEDALAAAAEPFHVLYYQESDGRFAHTAPDGTVRVIERPDAIRELTPATVIVKLNGGIAHVDGPDESAVITSSQFERLASQLPDVLPECARAVLRERSLLFLGQGLVEPDMNRIVKYCAQRPDRPRSWALRPQPSDAAALDTWKQRTRGLEELGVETLDADLEAFISDLRDRLRDLRP